MKNKILIISVVIFLTITLIITLSKLMAQIPQQPYKEIRKSGKLEFRYYPQAVMATVSDNETSYKKSSGNNFRKLANYIFGGNTNNTKIAMTAPVHMDFNGASSSMSFVMPEGYTLSNLPLPESKEIDLHETPEEYTVALRFGGYASDEKIEEAKNELQNLLKQAGITDNGNFRYLGYNAPWDFLFRRNEIVVSISKEIADRVN